MFSHQKECSTSSKEDPLCWIGAVLDQILLEKRAAKNVSLHVA